MIIRKDIMIELNDWDYLKSLNLNISELMRESMRQIVSLKKGNIEGINIEIEKAKLERLTKEIVKLQIEANNSKEILEKYQIITQNNKELALKQEKERIESLSKCHNCGQEINNKTKMQLTKDIIVCKTCFMNGDANKFIGQKL